MDNENKILTLEKINERRVNSQESIQSGLFFGDMKANTESKIPDFATGSDGKPLASIVQAAKANWLNSAEYHQHWNKIEDLRKKMAPAIKAKVNIENFPADYYTLIDLLRMDLTRRRLEYGDLTSMLTQEITNVNFSKSVNITEFLPYAGAFGPISLAGQNVPMLQQKTGLKGSVDMQGYGLGWERTLEDEIYNLDIFTMQKVMDAVARAHAGLRNNLGPLGVMIAMTVAGTWDPLQQVSPQGAIADSFDKQIWLTLDQAIEQLFGLLDPQTNQEIAASRLTLAVRNRGIARRINRVINGQLNATTITSENLAPLEIDDILVYNGDEFTVGPDKITYPGVPHDMAYLFVAGKDGAPAYTLNKRQLTQEIGRGEVLHLGREQRAWYFVMTNFLEEFKGSSSDGFNTPAGSPGYGFCVEIELPTRTVNT
jgi:hypothetical protein